MLAHELRNPLAAIRHAVDVLGEPVEDHETLEWARTVLDRQSRQLAAIVDDLLDIARITRGKITLRKVPVDFAAVVERAVEILTPPAKARSQRLALSIEGGPLWVEGDPARLEQIVVNLINNAIKHCDDGVHISAQIQREGKDVLLRVCDNGTGIDPDRLDHIFELFAQMPASTERGADGLGIGLTLIKRLTEMHGGSVRALSEGRGKGSEFQVRIPAWDAPVVPAAAPLEVRREATATASPRKPERILIVDDNEDSTRGLTRILERRHYEVRTVHTGAAALGAAQDFRPDVILLDIGLPGMNGHQVAEQLRANGFSETVLIAITGYGQERDIARSRQVGCDFHFVKPVDTDALLGAIDGTMPDGRL
ncbi:MAG: hybrid sensor histidine kinase/response regulator, partial [Chthoniobacteraceae bacterium]